MTSNVNPYLFYGTFILVLVLDLVAAYLHLLPVDFAQGLFLTVVGVLTGVHIPTPSSTPANPVTPSSGSDNPVK